MFELKHKNAVVTGAGSGIGEAIARALTAAGAFVFVADIDEENGRRVADEIGSNSAAFLKLDVAKESECKAVIAHCLAEKAKVDILVNNAGIGHVGTILETTSVDLQKLFNINVLGVFNLTKAVLPSMIEKESGVVINIASIGGVVAIRDRLAYCTTKFAIVGFTKAIALDHALEGIRSVAVCPGRVETPFVAKRIAEYPDPEKAYQEMASTQALNRMAKPSEIAAAVRYLASDDASFVTGTAFEIDGGFAAGK